MQIVEVKYKWNGQLRLLTRIDYIVLHHADISRCTPQDIHRWHQQKGWAGIGYHYFVAKDGLVYRGRPQNTIGAHCEGYNSVSLGICAEGNYEQEIMPAAQWQAIVDLLAELRKIYPRASIVGHKELYPTACPGRYYPLAEIKAGKGPVETIKEVLSDMFKDVPEDYWAKNSIERLAQLGLLRGDEQGRFRPDEPVTRAQLAAVLDRLINYLEAKK